METLKILVVDDEPGIRSGIARVLQQHQVSYPFMDEDFNFAILEAATGEEALDIIEKQQPDIVLLDNKLPGIQGTEVLTAIKEKQLNTLVAMITSYASLEVAVKATDNGAYDFIPKPFTPLELKSSIDHITKHLFLRRITQKMQQEGKQARFQFLSVLSHELKAPLNAIEGYLRIMQERQAGENMQAYDLMLENSLVRINGMRSMIKDLLDFSRIRFEQKPERLREVDLAKVADLAIHGIQPYAIQNNIQLFLHAPKEVIFTADPDHMDILFNNLVSNAVKYNVDDGRVDVWLEKKQDCIEIVVSDTGIGIDEDEQGKLFSEFTRIRNEKTKHISGSGLGLSIVKKVVDFYRGNIEIESAPGRGSKFKVRFLLNN